MALTAAQVADAWNRMRQQDTTLSLAFTKPDLAAAVTAADSWLTSNQAAAIASLPEPFKTTSTAQQKLLLLAYVCLKRAGF
jgi:hypothetical protein